MSGARTQEPGQKLGATAPSSLLIPDPRPLSSAATTGWPWRGCPTRCHPELDRETPQRRWYCVSRRGRVGRRSVLIAENRRQTTDDRRRASGIRAEASPVVRTPLIPDPCCLISECQNPRTCPNPVGFGASLIPDPCPLIPESRGGAAR